MGSSKVSAVLFVTDVGQLADFYERVLGLSLRDRDDQHSVLSVDGFDLVVHQIPQHVADRIGIEQPPRRREGAAIKLCFPVDSISYVRDVAASLGGELDPADSEWSSGNTITCKGHDPEGNVFQVFQVVR